MTAHEPLTDEQVRAIQPDPFAGTPNEMPWDERRKMAEFKAGLLRERAEKAEQRRQELVDQASDFWGAVFQNSSPASVRSMSERFVDLVRAISADR